MGRRGQEEIVGFVLIVVLVAVVFLILLGVWLRSDKPEVAKESRVLYQFLESSMESTSNCAINYEPQYSNMAELFKDCHNDAQCTSGKSACEVLNDTMGEILEGGWGSGLHKGYLFNAKYISNSTGTEKEIIRIGAACERSFRAAEYPIPASPGNIIAHFKVCY